MAWTSRRLQRYNVIATATASQPINVEGADFGNRLVTSAKPFDGKDFSVRIVPVLFQDAGCYRCFIVKGASVKDEGRSPFLTVDLITVKVRALPDIWIITVLGYLSIKLAVALGLICYSWKTHRCSRNPWEVTGHVTNDSKEAVALQTLNSAPDVRGQNE
ncbi:uncharacterized protein LOC144599913 [Rhinoraja longicauda]